MLKPINNHIQPIRMQNLQSIDNELQETKVPVLAVRGLTHATPDGVLLFENLEFTLKEGEALSIIGPSGVGKSTLLRLLSGLEPIQQGEVWLFDAPIHTFTDDARARLRRGRVGFVFQSFELLPYAVALENVMLPLLLSADRWTRKERMALAQQALAEVGLAGKEQAYPRQLSGGEKQRVAIARALLGQPTLLCADEPTGNLDFVTARTIQDLLLKLVAQQETALVLVTHDRTFAACCSKQLELLPGGHRWHGSV